MKKNWVISLIVMMTIVVICSVAAAQEATINQPVCQFQPLPPLNYCPINPVKIVKNDNYGFVIKEGRDLDGSVSLWVKTGTFADIWDNRGLYKRIYGPDYVRNVSKYVLFQKCEKVQ